MRALFYAGDAGWSGAARACLAAAHGMATRDHQVTFACCGGGVVEARARAAALDVVAIDPGAGAAATSWTLRRLLRDRFVEVAYVQSDRGQLVVSSAMRLAARGAVIRRVPSFEPLTPQGSGRVALRMAAAGLLFSSEREARECALAGFPIPPAVAPLGVDAESYDAVAALSRTELGAPATGLLVCCRYESAARPRIGNVFRTLAALAQRHRGIHLVMVGRGSDDADLRMHAAALGVNPIISFLGEREDELAVLRAADVGWVVADCDDGAFACLDFMAMRIPVLAERGAMPQHYVADGIAGVLLAPGDPPVTAAAVAAFIANTERRAAMGAAGRTRVARDFSESAMVDGFERAGLTAADRSRWSAR